MRRYFKPYLEPKYQSHTKNADCSPINLTSEFRFANGDLIKSIDGIGRVVEARSLGEGTATCVSW